VWNVVLYSVLMFGDKTRVKIKGSLSPPPLLSHPFHRIHPLVCTYMLFPLLRFSRHYRVIIIVSCSVQQPASFGFLLRRKKRRSTPTHTPTCYMYMCGVRVCVRGGGNPDKTESCYYIHSLGWVVAV